MKISMIAAMSEGGVIGKDNKMPWHLPEELRYFKKMTLGKPVIMGRKTFESMGSKPLPGRPNIILTRDPHYSATGATVATSSAEALEEAARFNAAEIMIIGGAAIYAMFLPLCTHLYLTQVHSTVSGDTFFPDIHWDEWQLITEQEHTAFTTQLWERKNKKS